MTSQNRSWMSRNWKWFVPVGCLGTFLLFLAFLGGILAIVFGAMKSSDVYKEAVRKAKAHTAVQEALGTPIEEGMFLSGSINVSGPSGDAGLAIPISGPNGSATIYVDATKNKGTWVFATLSVDIDGTGESIDLLQ
ncbi:Cytochrome oxidase complex assembly protein 1 [Sulfidibacter corallicola]|uniref:Cytochrome oxidase complex assembly protein 1 n=1 Tax=Sulfidibacter corallicola TaxID=2818388 RepID=A0A8A4TUE9_SULCO|nr:cytochrome c oxidase assembly factor Coa1 family protein [Sulfidibacter corallicola]QTD50155.1 hypothetical protein J3U87_31610 [Sulfidibacter corallicola]